MTPINIKPKKVRKLAGQLYEQLLDLIISGVLHEGDKLPSESELCKSFEVSRPTVRQAIAKLQEDKLVKTQKGRGTYVLNSPLKELTRFATANDLVRILESHEVRMALEVEAASLAAIRRTDENLKVIKQALAQMKRDFESQKLSIEADYNFHVEIARATGNEIFVQLLEDFHIGLKKTMVIAQNLSRESVKNEINSSRNVEVLSEHQKILDAIELQDKEAARLAMQYHIAKIKQRVINIHNSEEKERQ